MTPPLHIVLWHAPSGRFVVCKKQNEREGQLPMFKMLTHLSYEMEADAQRGAQQAEREAK